jgi:hypothetical protein
MTKFDFISVLVSIVFGLGLTHLLGGAFQLAHRRRLEPTILALAGFIFIVIVLNWWMFFLWHDRTEWTFETLLTLVAWALSFYAMAFALFPPDSDIDMTPATRYRGFALALFATMVLDVVQTALLGTLFEPWYYLPFAAQYAVCAVVIYRSPGVKVRDFVAWYLLVSMILWCLLVRRHLG